MGAPSYQPPLLTFGEVPPYPTDIRPGEGGLEPLATIKRPWFGQRLWRER
jgi:hypothetical protein